VKLSLDCINNNDAKLESFRVVHITRKRSPLLVIARFTGYAKPIGSCGCGTGGVGRGDI